MAGVEPARAGQRGDAVTARDSHSATSQELAGQTHVAAAAEEIGDRNLLTLVAEQTLVVASAPPARSEQGLMNSGATVGVFRGRGANGEPLVDFPGNDQPQPVVARTTVPLTPDDEGRELILLFCSGNPPQPVVMGVVLEPASPRTESTTIDARVDGKRISIEAQHELAIRCGDASITLTRAGKVLIRGKYILSRSSGLNRIKGAAVDVN